MSVRERPTNVASTDKGGGGDDDEDDPEPKNCDGCRKKGKGLSLFRRRKGKKLQSKKQKGNLVNSGGGFWFCLCLKQPLTLESSVGESPTSDPNSPGFSFDMLRSLIEKNEFYSDECNPHLDA